MQTPESPPPPEAQATALHAGLRQRRLHQILWVFICGFLLLAAMNLASGRFINFGLEILAIGLFALALRLNARANPDAAALITLTILASMMIALSLGGQGLYDEAPMTFPGVLLFACLFSTRRIFLGTTAIFLLALVAMHLLHSYGILPSTPRPTDLQRVVVLAIVLGVSSIFVFMVTRDMNALMRQLQTEKTALQASHSRIEELAYKDSLTQLPNRALAKDRLQYMLASAQRDEHLVAVMFLDLDNFKTINDSLGHAAGDALLCGVAQRFSSVLRASDMVARISGDEFLILLGPMTDAPAIASTAAKLMAQLDAPFTLDGIDIHATASLGIAVAPRDGNTMDSLLKNADLAMYQAKDAGRNTMRFFDDSMNTSMLENLHLATGLRAALANNALQLHYQPQWDLRTGQVIGAEALLRWQHPQMGWISPARFIPVAERSGLIHELGQWVMQQACRDAKDWQTQGWPGLRVAINVSALQFQKGDITHQVANALAAHQLPAHCLELEITESLLVSDNARLMETLHHLQQLGVAIAIDDFGTGYSNLGYLQRYAIDRLKIDQSFVRALNTGAQAEGIVRAIIEMAHCLKLEVVGEGIEDADTLQRLQSFGCELGQGFYWSPALPAPQFVDYLRQQQTAQSPAFVLQAKG